MSDVLTTKEPEHQCEVCYKNAKYNCSKCKKVYYCGHEHQKLHWSEHKQECSKKDGDDEKEDKGFYDKKKLSRSLRFESDEEETSDDELKVHKDDFDIKQMDDYQLRIQKAIELSLRTPPPGKEKNEEEDFDNLSDVETPLNIRDDENIYNLGHFDVPSHRPGGHRMHRHHHGGHGMHDMLRGMGGLIYGMGGGMDMMQPEEDPEEVERKRKKKEEEERKKKEEEEKRQQKELDEQQAQMKEFYENMVKKKEKEGKKSDTVLLINDDEHEDDEDVEYEIEEDDDEFEFEEGVEGEFDFDDEEEGEIVIDEDDLEIEGEDIDIDSSETEKEGEGNQLVYS